LNTFCNPIISIPTTDGINILQKSMTVLQSGETLLRGKRIQVFKQLYTNYLLSVSKPLTPLHVAPPPPRLMEMVETVSRHVWSAARYVLNMQSTAANTEGRGGKYHTPRDANVLWNVTRLGSCMQRNESLYFTEEGRRFFTN
jgi:hypothetical protein